MGQEECGSERNEDNYNPKCLLRMLYLCLLPEPGKMLMTPFGIPAFTDSSANFSAVNGVTCEY